MYIQEAKIIESQEWPNKIKVYFEVLGHNQNLNSLHDRLLLVTKYMKQNWEKMLLFFSQNIQTNFLFYHLNTEVPGLLWVAHLHTHTVAFYIPHT